MVAKFFGALFSNRRATQQPTELPPGAPANDDLRDSAAALNDLRTLVLGSGAEMPTIVFSRLRQLDDLLRPLIGYMEGAAPSTEQIVLLKSIVMEYVPSPLRTYLTLSLPHRQDLSRETAVLLDQLGAIYSAARKLDTQMRTGAITELEVFGLFLEDKFNVDGLRLEGS